MSDFPDFNHDGKVDGLDYALWDEICRDDEGSSSGSSSGSGGNSGCGTLFWILLVICAISIIFKQ